MGVLTRLACRTISQQRGHTLVAVIGIALSCSLITAIFTSVASLLDARVAAMEQIDGTWEAYVDGLSDAGASWIREAPGVKAAQALRRIGDAEVVSESGDSLGYLSLSELPVGDAGIIPELSIYEGSLPTTSDEILLPRWLKGHRLRGPGSEGEVPVNVDTTVTISAGRLAHRKHPWSMDADEVGSAYQESDWGIQRLENVREPRTFRVSGFYDIGSLPWAEDFRSYAFTAADPSQPTVGSEAFLTLDGAPDAESVRSRVREIIAAAPAGSRDPQAEEIDLHEVHNGLIMLRDSSIGPTDAPTWTMGTLLSLVVVLAGISLISNAFSISISERIRQFGLLASIGASRRQLKRIIYIEALILSAIGIPLGTALGLIGSWAVFRFAGEGVALFAGLETGALPICISPTALGAAALITLVSVIISAVIPAHRAARISAVDAIRQARDVQLSRAERRRAARLASHGWLDRLRLHIEGVTGWLAHRNLTRSSGRGRVASVSLALSASLIVVSGLLSSYLNVTFHRHPEPGEADLTATLTRATNEVGDGVADASDRVLATLSAIPGVRSAGYSMSIQAASLLSPGAIAQTEADEGEQPRRTLADGGRAGFVNLIFLDDRSWQAYLDELGLDPERFSDPLRPMAIGYRPNSYSTGSDLTPVGGGLTGTGQATILTSITSRADAIIRDVSSVDGTASVVFQRTGSEEQVTAPLSETATGQATVGIGSMSTVSSGIPTLTNYYRDPTLLLPASALPAIAGTAAPANAVELSQARAKFDQIARPFAIGGGLSGGQPVTFSIQASDPPKAEQKVRDAVSDILYDRSWIEYDIANYAEMFRQSNQILGAAGILATAFATITGLIAATTVFSTIATSIILRRREFAVLRSIGMGERAFRRMIAREVASFAVRGLVFGLALSVAANILINEVTISVLGGETLRISPFEIGLAVGAVLLILLASVTYALARSRTESIIEAIRDDGL